MGWEQRGNSSYYYTAARVGGRVVKSYVGTGRVAELTAQLDACTRAERSDKADADERTRRTRGPRRAAARPALPEHIRAAIRALVCIAGAHT